jgi:predicted ATP-grasp superfamily ATP-dependent carboligase
MRILVLDGNQNQAVACVRSLARAGHRVAVGAPAGWSKAGWSRYCTGQFTYPAPHMDGNAFVRRVAEEARREPGTLVLPMTEATTLPLSANRDAILEAGGSVALPPHETVLRAFDKQQTTALARSLGLAVPCTAVVENQAQADQIALSAPYPVVLKPRFSEEPCLNGNTRTTSAPLYACTPSQFMKAYGKLSDRSRSVLVQQFVPGGGAGYFALMRHGELRAECAHRRIRDVRPTGSGSAVRQSALPSPRMREAALAILRALDWHGVAMVEFRVREDGTLVFLEVNGRFWHSLALAVHAGVDFPRLLVEMVQHGDTAPARPYRPNVRCRWLLGDFRHLIEVWRGVPDGYPARFPGRLRALVDFLTPVPGTFHDNFQLGDPLPEFGDWLDFGLRRLPTAVRVRALAIRQSHVQRRYSHT